MSWCPALTGAHDRCFLTVWQLRCCPVREPSLTRGQICIFLVTVYSLSVSACVFTILHVWHVLAYTQYIRPLSVQARYSRLCPTNCSSSYHDNLHLNGRTRDRRQVAASYTFYVGLRLVQCCEHSHYHDSESPLPVACIISLCNHTHMEFGKPNANRGQM
jgi:hypothetical protein